MRKILNKLLVWNERLTNRIIATMAVAAIVGVSLTLWQYVKAQDMPKYDKVGMLVLIER